MKTMKVALLATAALAAVSVSARADDTAAIKAQLESLTARIAQLEAAPSVPTGFSLLTISEGTASAVPGSEVLNKDAVSYGEKATVIGILPTADMPATTSIEWSGFVRAAIQYTDRASPAKDGASFIVSCTFVNSSTVRQKGIITTTLLNPISSLTLLMALHSSPNASLYFGE